MYSDFFGLRDLPFEDRPDPRFLHPTPALEETLAALVEEAHGGSGLALVLGEPGVGKTLLTRSLVQRLHATDHTVVLTWPAKGAGDLLRETCKGFGVVLPHSDNRVRCLARLRGHLRRTAKADHRSVLIIDQAENLSPEALEDMSLLADLPPDGGELLTIILVGRPQLRPQLGRPQATALAQRLDRTHTLPPLTRAETAQYVQHRLRIAGAGETDVFDRKAIVVIHEAAQGIPRLINRMCDEAMRTAARAEQTRVTTAVATALTTRSATRERSAAAREVGVPSASELITGLAGPGRADVSSWPRHDPAMPQTETATTTCVQGDWAEGDDDIPPGDESTNAGGVVHGTQTEALARALDARLAQGEGLLARFERAFARAEQTILALETPGVEHAGVERRLTSLVEEAEQVCERTDCAESRLTSFAEDLTEQADKVQRNMAQLMTGLEAGAEMHGRLQAILEQMPPAITRAERETTAQQARLQETIDRAERLGNELMQGMPESFQAKIDEQLATRQQAHLETVEAAEKKLQATAGEARSRTERAQATIDELTRNLEDQVREHRQAHTRTAEAAQERLQGLLGRLSSATEAAEARVDEQRAAVQEVITQAEARVETLKDGLEARLQTEQQSRQDSIEVAEQRLRAVGDQAAAVISDAEAKLEEQRAAAQEVITQVGARAEAFKDGFEEQLQTEQQSRQDSIEAAEQRMRAAADQAAAVITDAEAKLDEPRAAAQEVITQVETRVGAFKDGLEEQLQAEQRSRQESIEAAEQRMRATVDQAANVISDAEAKLEKQRAAAQEVITQVEARLGAFKDGLEEQLQTEQRSRQENIEATEQRIQAATDQAATAIAETEAKLDERCTAVQEAIKQAEDLMKERQAQLDQSLHQTEQDYRQLATTALAEYQTGLAEQLEAQQRAHHEVLEAARKELQALDEQAATTTAETQAAFETALSTHRDMVRETIDQGTAQLQAVDGDLAAGREKLAQAVAEGKQALANLLETGATDVEEALATCRQATTDLIEEARREFDHVLESSQRSKDEWMATAGREVDELKAGVEAVEARRAEIQRSSETVTGDVEGLATRVSELSDNLRHFQTAITEETQRADNARTDLTDAVRRGEGLIRDVTTGCGQVEALQHNVTATLMDLGTAYERVSRIHEQTQDTEQTLARLDSARESGTRLESRFSEILTEAGKLRDVLQRMTVDAEGKITQLDSHAAAAATLLRQLSDANVTGHELVEKATTTTQTVEQSAATTRDRLEALIREASSITERTEAAAAELTNCNAHAGELIERIGETTTPAIELTRELTDRIETARQHTDRMRKDSGQVGKLLERLGEFTRILTAANETNARMKQAIDEARAMHDELALVHDNATQQDGKLRDANQAAHELIDSQTTLRDDARVAAAELAEQIVAANHLLDEFTNRCATLRNESVDLTRKATQIEESVARASAGPAQIVANAQTQAAQLEQVCGAVRKVFAGLAQTTLESRRHTEECTQAGEQAARRLSRLTAETERASNTLHEWVEEAVRVQARLERTLDNCPSIHETHPVDGVDDLFPSRIPPARMPQSPAGPQRTSPPGSKKKGAPQRPDRSARPPMQGSPDGSTTKDVASSPSRAEEIARMIDDAKRAAATAKS